MENIGINICSFRLKVDKKNKTKDIKIIFISLKCKKCKNLAIKKIKKSKIVS